MLLSVTGDVGTLPAKKISSVYVVSFPIWVPSPSKAYKSCLVLLYKSLTVLSNFWALSAYFWSILRSNENPP